MCGQSFSFICLSSTSSSLDTLSILVPFFVISVFMCNKLVKGLKFVQRVTKSPESPKDRNEMPELKFYSLDPIVLLHSIEKQICYNKRNSRLSNKCLMSL